MTALVVGHGVMGRAHARTLRRLGVEVITIDPEGQADYRSLSQAPDADLAVIACPPDQLVGQASDAASRGMDVLVEKPMAVDPDDAKDLLRAELASCSVMRVGYVERCNPAVEVLKPVLDRVGTIRHVVAQRLGPAGRCADAGVALDLLTHDIDVLRYLGLWPRFESATGTRDHLTVNLGLADGSATLTASHLSPTKQRTLTVVGDEGSLQLDYQRQTVVFRRGGSGVELDVPRREPLELQWLRFLADRSGVTVGDALATLKLACRAEDAATVAVAA